MTQLIFGKTNKLIFQDEDHFFKALGFLVASSESNVAKFALEHNEDQGAWGHECRIRIYSRLDEFKALFANKVTAGVGNCIGRINCNDYLAYLESDFCFNYTGTIVKADVESSIPPQHRNSFNDGYNL